MDRVLAFLAKYQRLLAVLLLLPLVADAFMRLTGSSDGLGANPHVLEALAFACGVLGIKRPSELAHSLAQSLSAGITDEDVQAWRADAARLKGIVDHVGATSHEELQELVKIAADALNQARGMRVEVRTKEGKA